MSARYSALLFKNVTQIGKDKSDNLVSLKGFLRHARLDDTFDPSPFNYLNHIRRKGLIDIPSIRQFLIQY